MYTHCYNTVERFQSHSLTIMAQNQNFSSSEQPYCRKGSIQKLWIKTSKFRTCSVLHSCKKSNQVRERERARNRERERERERESERGRERETQIKNWQERCFHIVINRKEFKTTALLSWCQNRKLSSLDQPKRRKNAPSENEEKEHQNRTPHVRRRKKTTRYEQRKRKKFNITMQHEGCMHHNTKHQKDPEPHSHWHGLYSRMFMSWATKVQ